MVVVAHSTVVRALPLQLATGLANAVSLCTFLRGFSVVMMTKGLRTNGGADGSGEFASGGDWCW